jgi:cytoskeleton protein RodZ
VSEGGAEPATVAESRSSGRILAQARQKQDLSVADVARALRLGVKQIEALESDDFDRLPGRTFVRGFIRNYARLLQLDPDQLLDASALGAGAVTVSQAIQVPSQHIRFSESRAKPWMRLLAAGVVLVALVSWGVLEWLGPEQRKALITPKSAAFVAAMEQPDTAPPAVESPSPEAPALLPVPAAPPAQPAPVVAPVPPPPVLSAPVPATAPQSPILAGAKALLALDFSGESWVDIRDKSGKRIFSQMNKPGTQQTVAGEPPFSLVIGNSPKVKLTYKGQPVDLAANSKADVAHLTLE